jgi:hypothetical protein
LNEGYGPGRNFDCTSCGGSVLGAWCTKCKAFYPKVKAAIEADGKTMLVKAPWKERITERTPS